jgi:hypothetical protein
VLLAYLGLCLFFLFWVFLSLGLSLFYFMEEKQIEKVFFQAMAFFLFYFEAGKGSVEESQD